MTPLSVYLPFNVDCLRGGGSRPPEGGEPGAPPRGVDSMGTRFGLGTWHGEPCWVAARPKDAPVPEGLAAETLVPMQGTRLPDELLTVGGMAMQLLYWESTRSEERRVGKECGAWWGWEG